jgi:hypothetical protein
LISKPHKYTIKIGNGKLILSILCVYASPPFPGNGEWEDTGP